MRGIQVSTDVFARIWSLRLEGEDSEDAILRRVLWAGNPMAGTPKSVPKELVSDGLCDQRFGIVFPEGFQIERTYLGRNYRATVQSGQWVIDGVSGRFSRLNELSRAVGTKTENAWVNWFFIDESGRRRPVSDLRHPDKISARSGAKKTEKDHGMSTVHPGEKVRWCDDVRTALQQLGGKAPLARLYRRVEEVRRSGGRSIPPTLEEVVRKELEVRSSDSDAYDAGRGEDWFEMAEGKGSGVWAIRTD